MKFLAFIPARYASTRFPGKPLADIGGKTMIQRVYERVKQVKEIDDVIVLSDDDRILKHVESFGGKSIETDQDIPNGTHRCHQGYERYVQEGGKMAEIILNVQGDEPFIQTEAIKQLLSCFDSERVEIATLAKRIEKEEDLLDPNIVKLVFSVTGKALYFSRSPIPFVRDTEREEDKMRRYCFYKHIGLYAYRPSALSTLVKLDSSRLENVEKLEQLRWLENNLDIWVKQTDYESFSVDTPHDLEILNTIRPWI